MTRVEQLKYTRDFKAAVMIHLTRKALAWLQLGYHDHVEART